MKKSSLLFFILILVCSCSGHQDIKALLSRSEFLMSEYPDSSYTLLRSINTNHLFNRGEKAKYSLLMTEAQYKNYEVFENDSLINISVKYYEKNGERRDYGRSLMYRGTVLYDMMDYNGAMESYKKAEEVMEPLDEYLTLGLINTRIGELYRQLYLPDSLAIDRHKLASQYFFKADDTRRMNTAYCMIASGYLFTPETDSTLLYLYKSIKLSKELEDTSTLLFDYELLSHFYIKNKEYIKAKGVALEVIKDYKRNLVNITHNLSVSYARLGQIDSAYYYYDIAKITDSADFIDYVTLSEIAESSGDLGKALYYQKKIQSYTDSLYNDRNRQNVLLIEKRFDYQKVAFQEQKFKNRYRTQIIFSISSVIIMILLVFLFILVYKKNKRKLSDQTAMIEQMKIDLADNRNQFINNLFHKEESEANALRELLEEKISVIKQLVEVSYEYSGEASKDSLVREYKRIMSLGKLNEGIFKDISKMVNIQYKGIIDKIKNEHSELNDKDLQFVSLLCCDFSTSAICAFYGYTSPDVVYVRKSRISKKMRLMIPLDQYISDKKSK